MSMWKEYTVLWAALFTLGLITIAVVGYASGYYVH